jgi:hypothetical protein
MSNANEDQHPIGLNEALHFLAEVHTKYDLRVGFVVPLGATPESFQREYYIRCWETVRRHLGLTVDPVPFAQSSGE